MKRRNFVQKATAGLVGTAGAVALAGCGNNENASGSAAVHTQPKLRWRLVSSFPRSLDTIFGASDVLTNRVKELTNGNFEIRAYPAGEIVGGLEVLDTVQQGIVQMGHTASYYYKGKNPALSFDCSVPFGLTARQQNAWLYHAGGSELMQELFDDFNIINLPGGNTGTQMGGWFRDQVNNLNDLKKIKMRIPGMGGEVMSRLGATVQVIPGGDIFPALERGTIDATEWVGPYDDEKLGFYKVAKNYYYPGWWEPGPNLSFYINKEAWAGLPSAYQAALKTAAAEANMGMLAKYDALNPPALARLLDKGVKLRAFSEDILVAAHRESFALMEEHAAEDEAYRKVFTAWKKFRTDSYRWFDTNEQAYNKFAFAR